MECCTASMASDAGRKSLTATCLFSFFLSVLLIKDFLWIITWKKKHSAQRLDWIDINRQFDYKKDTIFKKATDFGQTMWWQLLNVIKIPVLRVISTNSNYLIIFLTLLVRVNKVNIQWPVKHNSRQKESFMYLINHRHEANCLSS